MSHVKNLKLDFENFNLLIDDLTIPDKGITALMGPSGCGKSTFLKCLLGIHRPKGFVWEFNGEDLGAKDLRERRVGIVFQECDIFPHMTVLQNLKFSGKARATNEDHLNQIINALGLEKILQNKGTDLSGGERQRVALGNALNSGAQILLLDEPFSNLDEDSKQRSRELVKGLVEKFNIPAILVTHDTRDVELLASKVYLMREGRVRLAESSG